MANIPRRPFVVSEVEELAFRLPSQVTIALDQLTGAVKHGLLSLSVGAGLAMVREIMDAEVSELVGLRGKHDAGRMGYRHGDEKRQLTLGGRRVEVRRPRARSKEKTEVELKSYEFFASRDLLDEAALNRMLNGLATRRYRTGLEPVGDLPPLATGKSAISRRFVAGTTRKLKEFLERDLSRLDLMVLYLDGIETAEHTIVVAMGIDAEGRKHPLGLVEGSTENRRVCQQLLNDLVRRGLDPDRARLVVIDGGKGLRSAVKDTFGRYALVARCRAHKRRNVLGHLAEDQRAFIGRKLDRAWAERDADRALSDLRALANQLQADHPGAATSLREGLEETLTVSRLNLSSGLVKTLKSTNPIESMISVARTVTGNVKRWRNGSMILRWTAAGILEAETKFRRINGYRDLQLLHIALQAHQAAIDDEEKQEVSKATAVV